MNQKSTAVGAKQILSRLDKNGQLRAYIAKTSLPDLSASEVLVEVEAAPINPSDLGLLFASADVAAGVYSEGQVLAMMPEASFRTMTARIGLSLAIGNEGAGKVIAAGESPAAQALVGRRVAVMAGGMFANRRIVDARSCLALPKGTSAEQGAGAFVNPMTALAFVEQMRLDGHTALVHTAAASNLGQMLVRICRADGIPLVNIVRSQAQVALLRGLGAEHVIDSSQPDFGERLDTVIAATGATIMFDAIGGGPLVGQILASMERHAAPPTEYSRYGAAHFKQAYIYGALDMAPTVIDRRFGFAWSVSGWLLTPFLARAGEAVAARIRDRVFAELTTTFASHYQTRITLGEMLEREHVLAYNARRTGEKYLVLPNG